MARDLFAELGAPAQSDQERDLFGEIDFKPSGGRGTYREPRQEAQPQAPAPGRGNQHAPRTGTADTGFFDSVVDTVKKLPATAEAAVRGLPTAGAKIGYATQELADAVTYPIDAVIASIGNATGLFNFDPDKMREQNLQFWQSQIDTNEKSQQEARPEYSGKIQQGLLQGIESIPTSLIAAAAGVVSRNPNTALGIMGTTTGVPAYTDARQAGKDVTTALRYGIEQGGVEALTEMIPISSLIKDIAGKTSFGKTLMIQLAEEIPGEQVATLLQDLSEQATMHPEKTFGEYIAERPDAAMQTLLGTVSATVLQTAAIKGGEAAMNKALGFERETNSPDDPLASFFNPDPVDPAGRLATRNPADARPAPLGTREQAQVAALETITPEDEASPLDTLDIAAGRAELAKASAGELANEGLEGAGLPKVGSRVVVDMGNGQTETGVMDDHFSNDDGDGVVIKLDNGRTLREYSDTLRDAGVSVTAAPLAEADAIDAALADMVPQLTPVALGEPEEEPAPDAGVKPGPVADGGSVIREIFGDRARITQTRRDPNSALGKANPKSYHTRTNAAVDMAPIEGMTFEQAKAAIEAQGYNLIEAIDEVKNPSKHATGPHWHFVIGQGGGTTTAAPATEPRRDDVTIPRQGNPEAEKLELKERPREEIAADLAGEAIDKEWTAFAKETGTLDIPRAEMPQIKAEHRGAMVNFLNARGIEHEEVNLPAADLKPSQREFSPEKVKKALEFEGGDRAILISQDGHVVDGHHQWLASRDKGEEIRAIRLKAPIRDVLEQAHAFPSSTTAPDRPESRTENAKPSEGPEAPAAPQRARMVPTSSGKGVAVIGASAEIQAAIAKAVPKAKAVPRKDGALVYSAKYDFEIRNAISSAESSQAAAARKHLRRPVTGKAPTNLEEALETLRAMKQAPKIDDYDPSRNHAAHALSTLEQKGLANASKLAASTAEIGESLRLNVNEQRAFEILRDAAPTEPKSTAREEHFLTREPQDDLAKFAGLRAAYEGRGAGLLPGQRKWMLDNGYAAERGKKGNLVLTREGEQELKRAGNAADATLPTEFQDEPVREAPVREAPSREPEAPTGPSPNRLVTDDRAAELRARLKEKLNPNRLNSGIDPELIAIGTELAVYHIEKGARRFQAFAKAIAQDLDMPLESLRRYLRGWYNGARDFMEDHGESVAGMDSSDEVGKAMRTFTEWSDQESVTDAANPSISDVDAIRDGISDRDAGTGTGDVQGAPQDRSNERASNTQEPGSSGTDAATVAGPADAAERGTGESGRSGERQGTGVRDPDNLPAGQRDTGSRRGLEPAAGDTKGADWTIEPGSLAEERSAAQKARDNIEAIALVKQIEAEGRPATRDEQAIIARYVGWGGLKNVFPDTQGKFGKGFEELGPRLRELLTDEEYETARRSIQYAHFTGETVVRAMWDAAQRLGFRGGTVYEPGMGTGNFRGMMPAEIAAASQYSGIEYDHLTASIARLLYPKSGVRQADYSRIAAPKDAVDLVIGNPPFSETVVKADSEYAKYGFVLHDYFFAKSLDAVKPGGLLLFVTSAGTMNKVNTKAREYLADRADLVGAIRLPGNTFEKNAGTSVTTDIVILRKRLPGQSAGDRSWTDTVRIPLKDREGNTIDGNVSAYFTQNPDMVLGEQGMFDKLVAGPRYAVRAPAGFDLQSALQAAIDRLPAADTTTAPKALPPGIVETSDGIVDLGSGERKEGSFYTGPAGELMQYSNGAGREVQAPGKGVKSGISAAAQQRIKGLIPIKNALRDVYAADLRSDEVKGDRAREALNKHYDAFVKKFGPINKTEISYRAPSRVQIESARAAAREEARLAGNIWEEGSFDIEPYLQSGASMADIARARTEARDAAKAAGRDWDEGSFNPEDVADTVIEKRPNLDPFMADEEGYRLAAIEDYNKETGEARKLRVFYENAVRLDTTPKIDSAQDALLYSLNRLGRPDITLIADMAGMSKADVVDELADQLFEVPGQADVYQTAETYLSGNVREKLAIAREAAQRDPAFQRNVRALEDAQPAPLTPSEIAAGLGMPWIPTDVVEKFATERMGLNAATVKYVPKLAQWMAAGDSYSAAATSTWGTTRRKAMELLEAALNRQTVRIVDRMSDGSSVFNAVETQAAQDKIAEMKAAFRDWVWSDEARAERLTNHYNQEYNSLVAPAYDGQYLTTPGIASNWQWRPHQTRVIARIVQAGNTYMAHEVGAGKTSAMIGAGMEMKRLGLVNKPMYVVPNHMLGQFTKEFYEQYPLARIKVADEQRFHTSRRKEFVAQLAAEDFDAVIITHSAFGFIPISDEFNDTLIQNQIDDLVELLSEVDKGERITRRKIEQQKESLEQRLVGKKKRSDQVFTFEETGVDFLFVDEAHLFRKLDFSTKMGDVKGIDPSGSKMSFDLFAKTRYLEEQKPGRNLVLASGTPITNTMAELYSVSRYLQQGELERRGLAHFDAWAGAFGDTVTALEQDPAGNYKAQTRFAQFVNVPELSVMVRQVMDVVGSAELRQYVSLPTLEGGERQMVLAEQTDNQSEYQEELKRRMEAIQRRSGPPQKGDDILLSVIGDGRKSAIDYRLIDATAPREEGSKLELMIAKVAELHKKHARAPFHKPLPDGKGYSEKPVSHGPAAQMIFADFGINGAFPLHKYVKQSLIARGIPEKQIALISDYKTHVAKQRLFNDINEGKVRVLIGSVAKMGTGVNAQKRLRAIHNMDAQWYPANDTQRNGRGIRQGNMNPEIGIYDYSTQGTYDSQMWALMAKKAKFIEGFMRGDPTMRDMEDLGEASQYEQAQALTTSDPRIMTLTEWKQELEALQRRKVAHERDQHDVRNRIRYAKADIADAEKRIPLIEQDIARRAIPEKDAFTGSVGGQTFTDRAEFGKALLESLDGLKERANGKSLRDGIGEFAGFALVGEIHNGPDGPVAAVAIKRAGNRESIAKESEDSAGMVTRLVNALQKFDAELAGERETIESGNSTIEDYSSRVGGPFEDGGRMDELRQQIGELEATLAKESADKEAARQRQPAPPVDGEVRESIPEDLPTVSVQASDWGKLPTQGRGRLEVLRGRVQRWYRGLLGSSVTTADGRKVNFNKVGLKKSIRAGEDLLLASRAIPKILERGKLVRTTPSNQPGIKALHAYGANVRVGDAEPRAMVVSVREAPDGNFHYSLHEYSVEAARDVSAEADRDTIKAIAPALEGGARDRINLRFLGEESNNVPERDIAALEADMRKRLDGMGLKHVRLRLRRNMLGGSSAQGQFIPALNMIEVALDAVDTTQFVLNHEAIHALRKLEVFNKTDWQILAAAARRDQELWASINRRYQRLTLEQREEEAVADMFGHYQAGRYSPKGTIERIFMRIVRFLSALRNSLHGQGFTTKRTFHEIFGEVSSGRMADNAGRGDAGQAFPNTGRAFSEPEGIDQERNELADVAGSGPTWRDKVSDKFDRWRTAAQDRYLPLLRVQQEIERQTGQPLPERLNPYLGEELMTGRIGSRLEKLSDDMVAPMFDAMHEAGVSVEELETYLYARHAPERNARIFEINPDFEEGSGSGMTDIEARAVMNRIERSGKMPAMERLAAFADAIRDYGVDYRVETGLLSEEEADQWRRTYEHYVPLRGFAEVDGNAGDPAKINRSGGGINVRGRETRSAFGRRSQADSPLSYLILQAEEAIVRGETNRVAQRFVELAQANPDKGFWQVNKVSHKPGIDPQTGLVAYSNINRLLAEDADWTVSAKFDGKETRVTMNRDNAAARRLADSMRNLTQHQLDWVTLHLGKVNRFLSAVNTSYNPEFVISNAIRDLQTATVNLAGVDVKGLETGTLRDYRKALVAATKGAFNKGEGEWKRWHDEFIADGGRVYFNQVENVAEIKKRIKNGFEMAAVKNGSASARLQVKRGFLAVRDLIEGVNTGVENAIRLAAYKNARELGMSRDRSASLAKNLTVNFNRRGTLGPALNAAYLFYNAAIQGSTRIVLAMRSKRVRRILASVVLSGALIELINAMVSDDDDDGESFYDKIPDYEKSRNMIVMLPGGREYLKIPLPYGYNAFWEGGRSVAEVARRGGDRWKDTAGNYISTVVDAFNPVGGTTSLLNFIAPTIVDPFVDLERNEDFTGRPIMPKVNPYDSPDPDHLRYFNSVAPHWRAVADGLNWVSGGNQIEPGLVDVSPETLEYMMGQAIGAAGAFADRMAALPAKLLDPDVETTVNDFPMGRKVFGQKAPWYDKDVYYDRLAEVDRVTDYTKDFLDAGLGEQAAEYAERNVAVLSMEQAAKDAKREMKKVRKARNANEAAFKSGGIDKATYQAERSAVFDAEDMIVQDFNTKWNATMKGTGSLPN